ncbi:hypothetical protein DXT88_03800 [Herbaspirillum lusitanum]|uniref:hypothetical protein n=1 Tax=Herbaspirillum lusitanum TaxID=213312 RepID=UPI002237DEEA|nr:hypothetical protein [Herbaspirillum lusitanum]MCW5297291.1 hypothetical protein [Herbaspirillum lusitanum]
MKNNTNKKSILLFEDDETVIRNLSAKIEKNLGATFELLVFPLNEKPKKNSGPFEDRLVSAMRDDVYKNVVLIVTDRDLSTQQWGGLSEAAVTRAAQEFGLPVACYRQAKLVPEERLRRIPGDGRIELPINDQEELARQVVLLAEGFVQLEDMLRLRPKTGKKGSKVAIADHQSPGMLLAEILQHPEAASHFDTYACGDQGAIAEILTMSAEDKAQFNKNDQRVLIVALGVWIADLVMQYPGVLLNEIAAASYLDIHPTDFRKEAVRNIFKEAEYKNLPFANPQQPMWWRHSLDDLINEVGVTSGLELCSSKGIKRLRFCPCSVDDKLHAGYYCMATDAPISAENSSGRVSWFPPGADLARLTKKTYRKLAPWIGA